MNVATQEIVVQGRIVKVAKLRNEWYDFLEDPMEFVAVMKKSKTKAHLFTFLQEPHELEPKYPFHLESDSISVLPISTYDHWFKKQINDKTRNMIRKASKNRVELRLVNPDDDFVQGVVDIYQESPTRQGKRFWHYGKDFETIKRELVTFSERSHFVGAFHGAELIGFFKLTRNKNSASLMQIISKIAHRNKAPSNALLARAVEMCAEMQIPYLQYGIWSRGGLGEYKVKHGFLRFDVPRYFVPLNALGQLTVRLRPNRNLTDLIPEKLVDGILSLRAAYYAFRYKKQQPFAGQ
jgi:hypothetical protein